MHCGEGTWDMMSILVTVLCNQPEAFASDLGDNQSRYFLPVINTFQVTRACAVELLTVHLTSVNLTLSIIELVQY